MILIRDVQHSLAIPQAVSPTTFDVDIEEWLDTLPTGSLAAEGMLPPPGQVLCRPGYADSDVRIQRDQYLAVSGTVSVTLDAVRLSIRAPPFLFLSAHPPTLSIWLPISDWDNVCAWTVTEALQHATRSLLRPYDPTETLFGQIFAKAFVSLQVQRLRCMIGAMPIAVWDVQATPTPFHMLRWSSNWDLAYAGPPGQVFYRRTPGANQAVFTFEIYHPARFVFQYTLDTQDEHLDPHELRDLVKDMVYIE